MATVTVSMSDAEFINLVREAMLGDISEDIVTDTMIDEQKDRVVIPLLEDKGVDGSSDKIDTAVAALTAEKAFKSWLKKQRIGGGGEALSVSLDIESTMKDLEDQSQTALQRVNVTWSPRGEGAAFVDSTTGWFD